MAETATCSKHTKCDQIIILQRINLEVYNIFVCARTK